MPSEPSYAAVHSQNINEICTNFIDICGNITAIFTNLTAILSFVCALRVNAWGTDARPTAHCLAPLGALTDYLVLSQHGQQESFGTDDADDALEKGIEIQEIRA